MATIKDWKNLDNWIFLSQHCLLEASHSLSVKLHKIQISWISKIKSGYYRCQSAHIWSPNCHRCYVNWEDLWVTCCVVINVLEFRHARDDARLTCRGCRQTRRLIPHRRTHDRRPRTGILVRHDAAAVHHVDDVAQEAVATLRVVEVGRVFVQSSERKISGNQTTFWLLLFITIDPENPEYLNMSAYHRGQYPKPGNAIYKVGSNDIK